MFKVDPFLAKDSIFNILSIKTMYGKNVFFNLRKNFSTDSKERYFKVENILILLFMLSSDFPILSMC